jgi:hypothetical protein
MEEDSSMQNLSKAEQKEYIDDFRHTRIPRKQEYMHQIRWLT